MSKAMKDIADVMRERMMISLEYRGTGTHGPCGYATKPDAECIAAADEIARLRARIAELERWKAAVESEMAANWQSIGLYSSAPPGSYACGYRQGCISSLTALRAAIEKATKP